VDLDKAPKAMSNLFHQHNYLSDTFNQQASTFWDDFYSKNTDKFFKDRHWLTVEFPDIFNTIRSNVDETTRIFEIGCGAGNTVFPILAESKPEDKVYVYAGDFSLVAVDVVKSNANYIESRCKAFVYDVTSPELPVDIEPGSIDVCICIFVLSAVHPDKWETVRDNLWRLLKPGGLVIFRDYGRYDLAQLRFKQNRVLGENFYVRGDGTQVYFFTTEELETGIFKGFHVEQNAVDRRLLVNRAKKIKMYRVWIQGKFRKPLE
jgi:tRNAThr (cytosine32-N3)-methyltransferase